MIPRKDPVIIIGMHRSGTTYLTSLLHNSGIFMGNDQGGTNESLFFQRINRQLINSNNLSWDKPGIPSDYSKVRWNYYRYYTKYAGIFSNQSNFEKVGYAHNFKDTFGLMARKPWGWKDPRNTFTLPYWLRYFPKAKIIHIYRNGMDVAISLFVRNRRVDPSNSFYSEVMENKLSGIDIWEQYVAQCESYKAQMGGRMLTIQFEDLIAGNASTIEQLETFLGKKVAGNLKQTADTSRTNRFEAPEHQDLVDYAQQSEWMKKLGYV
jgi:hypothetical protein